MSRAAAGQVMKVPGSVRESSSEGSVCLERFSNVYLPRKRIIKVASKLGRGLIVAVAKEYLPL